MPLEAQTKTSQGFIPFEGGCVQHQDGLSLTFDAFCKTDKPAFQSDDVLTFNLYSPQECARRETDLQNDSWRRPSAQTSLVNLGVCLRRNDDTGEWEPDAATLVNFAQGSGPLFGKENGQESYLSWAYAADTAFIAIRLQECANGKRSPRTLKTLKRLKKLCLNGNDALSVYGVSFRMGPEHDPMLDQLPLVRRTFGVGQIFYAFVYEIPNENQQALSSLHTISCMVVAVSEELTRQEFHLLFHMLCSSANLDVQPELETIALEYLSPTLADINQSSLLLSEGAFHTVDTFSENDLPALETLVQTMTAANLSSAQVDPFLGDRVTGFLSFKSLYSWLWYDFAHNSDAASIGYCEECGRPFSLVGHRGIERRYCSQACKTAAKNDRSRKQRDQARAKFMKGASVPQIAQELYGGTKADEKRVREQLSQWVQLKHVLENELQDNRTDMLSRCIQEGLDMSKLLSAKSQHLLRTRNETSKPTG